MIEIVKLLGTYNNEEIYFIINKYGSSLYYNKKYYKIPQFIEEPSKLGLMRAIKIIQNRIDYLKKKADNINNGVQEHDEPTIST